MDYFNWICYSFIADFNNLANLEWYYMYTGIIPAAYVAGLVVKYYIMTLPITLATRFLKSAIYVHKQKEG